jgi:peptidylprolyl isomerase
MSRTTFALSLGLAISFAAFGCEEKSPAPSTASGPTGAVSLPPKTAQPASRSTATTQPVPTTQKILSSPNHASPGYQPPPPDVAAPPKDAAKTASGLASKVLKKGSGKVHPKATDTVKVHYTGWTTDGRMFDSSVARNTPATFPLNRVIPGWTEGVQLMVVGEKRRFWIPEELAYKGRPGAPAGMLVFDVELLDIVQPPEVPKDVKAPPKDAQKTASGLASKVLKKGTGTAHPAATDRVTVHYSGWTTDGKMFDSSVTRGQPATFPLNRVIPGWTEGVQLMVEGEKRRFWIPEELAYKGRPGPQGLLVFDVELIKIVPAGAMGGPHGPGDGHGH